MAIETEVESKSMEAKTIITPTVDITGFREFLKKCNLTPGTIKRYCKYVSTVSSYGHDIRHVTEDDVKQVKPPNNGQDLQNWMAAVRKYIQFLNGDNPHDTIRVQTANLGVVGRYCMGVIRERGLITPKELRELCREKFPYYKIGRNTIGLALSEYVKQGGIYKRDTSKNRTVYSLEKYEKKNKNKCNICGRIIEWGARFCRECEPEALKIVEQCFPCPIPPDYSDRRRGLIFGV